jgi:hypothetical protein
MEDGWASSDMLGDWKRLQQEIVERLCRDLDQVIMSK